VIWGAGKEEELPGAPVVTAGNIPLLTDVGGLTDRHEIHLRLRPDFSTLQESPNWPILMWNLVQWRAAPAPGPSPTHPPLCEETALTLASARDAVEVVDPGGRTRTVAVQGRSVAVKAEEVGVYHLRADQDDHAFAANALHHDESDLTGCTTGRWGDWLDDTTL